MRHFIELLLLLAFKRALWVFTEPSELALFMADFYFYIRMTSAQHIIADFVLENRCFWLGGALEGF